MSSYAIQIFACLDKQKYTPLLILHEIKKKLKKIQFRFFAKKSLKNHNLKNICPRDFCLAPNEREFSNLLIFSILSRGAISQINSKTFVRK